MFTETQSTKYYELLLGQIMNIDWLLLGIVGIRTVLTWVKKTSEKGKNLSRGLNPGSLTQDM